MALKVIKSFSSKLELGSMHIGEGELRASRVPERNLCKAGLQDLQMDECSYEAQLELCCQEAGRMGPEQW